MAPDAKEAIAGTGVEPVLGLRDLVGESLHKERAQLLHHGRKERRAPRRKGSLVPRGPVCVFYVDCNKRTEYYDEEGEGGRCLVPH